MKKDPLVSVIIPAYNEENYIKDCLESIFEQTYKNIEIIVLDDGSTDDTKSIIEKFPVSYYLLDHKGPGVARNYGGKKAKGEILVFLDADMRYHREYISNLIKPIIKGKAVGTFNKEEYVANTTNMWANCWSINSGFKIGKRTDDTLPDELDIFRAIKKDSFMEVKGFNSSLGYADDRSLARKLKMKSLYAPGAIAYHYNPETLSEVFYSARWISRSRHLFRPTLFNFFRFSFFNSIRIALKKIREGAPKEFIIFKLIYDFGAFSGIFLSFGKVVK